MPLIDQRILIDAPSEVVWQVLSDQSQLAQWHAGYTSVSVLTTQQRGAGVRRRCTLASGKDVIEEITNWIEGMGYEYQRVEGGPYRTYRGRLRLQLGPDGTSVQWTIDYTARGIVGRLRNRFGRHKALAQTVTASLRQLRREVDALGRRMDDEARARASIRERLNANERAAAYAARHPAEAEAPGDTSPPAPPPLRAEPSFVQDLVTDEPPVDPTADTQPQEAQATTAQPAQPPSGEPGAAPAPAGPTLTEEEIPLHQRVTPARGIPSVQPSSQVVERPAPPPSEPPVPPPPEIKPPPEEAVPPPAEIKPPAPATEAEVDPYARFRRPDEAPLPAEPPPTEAAPAEPEPRPGLPPQTPITDTGEISIWDVFGIRRPSEQDSDALDDLIQSIQARHMAEQRLHGRFGRWSARVRFRDGVRGLRLRLALRASGVRLRHQLRAQMAREK